MVLDTAELKQLNFQRLLERYGAVDAIPDNEWASILVFYF
jgi:hypothetical protein